VLDAGVVDERIAGDRAGDRQAERDASRVGLLAAPADQDDPETDYADACGLRRRARCAERADPDDEDDDRRDAACDRIDERELGAPVRRREQRDVHELERGASDYIRPHGRIDVPRQERRRRKGDHPDDDCDRGRRLGVPRARE
jgi:hypothetical protein